METIMIPQLSNQAEVVDVRDLFWANPENTVFNCMLVLKEPHSPQPFGCSQIEAGFIPYVTQIWNNAMAGLYGPIASYIEPIQPSIEAQPDQPVVEGAMTL